jgi:tetratricopeptide (TPR) repeat protein
MGRTTFSKEKERHKSLTATDELRDVLDTLEVQISVIKRGTAEEAQTIPVLLDRAHELLTLLHKRNSPIRAEEVRLQSLLTRLDRFCIPYVQAVGGREAVRDLRAGADNPTPEQWWWFMDQRAAEQRRDQLQRSLRIALIVVAVLAAAVVFYNLFLQPDPLVVARLEAVQAAEILVTEDAYPVALDVIEAELTQQPEDLTLLLYRAILLEHMGEAEAAAAFESAEAAALTPQNYRLNRGNSYLRLGEVDTLLADMIAFVDEYPDVAEGYYLLGAGQQMAGDLRAALNSFEQAAAVASETQNTQLEAVARTQIAQLMQAMMAGQIGEPTLTPSP